MTRSRENRLFDRFCRTGDTKALAALFDLTAAELMRIAIHLTGDRHQAEDLVQTTFLVAIEDKDSYDPGCPVLPWLLGILANRARYWHRKERGAKKPGRLREAPTKDPAGLAEESEFREALRRATRSLPEPYHQVLILHLEHGLGGKEIAELHGCSPNTVRSQLMRGLDLLRKALPAGFAVSSAVLMAQDTSLAAVRINVLTHAGAEFIPATTVTLFGGALIMSKTAAISSLVAVAAALAIAWPFLMMPRDADEGTDPHKALAAGATQKKEATPGQSQPSDAGTSSQRSPLNREPAHLATSPDRANLKVHAKWGRDGTPAAGIKIRMYPVARHNGLGVRIASTNASGLATFLEIPPGKVHLSGDRGGKAKTSLSAGEVGRTELIIPEGVMVTGRVVDITDRPIPNARIWVSASKHSCGEGFEVTHADEAGDFALLDVSPGRMLSALAAGFRPAQVVTVKDSNLGSTEVTLKLTPASGTLHGIVYDPDGRASENALILVGQKTEPMLLSGGGLEAWPTRQVRTDSQGRFVVDGLRAASWPPVWARAMGTAIYRDRIRIQKYAPTQVEVRLIRGATVYGAIRLQDGEPASGIPVEALQDAVEPRPGGRFDGPNWAEVSTLTDADGNYRLDHILPGKVRIRASSPKLGMAARVFNLVDVQEKHWDATLGSGLYITGILVDSEGNALEGWKLWGWAGKKGIRSLPSTTSDVRGEFTLSGCEQAPYTIVVKAPNIDMHYAQSKIEDVQPGDPPLRIEVPSDKLCTSYLTGKVLTSDGRPVKKARMFLSWIGKNGTQESAGSWIECQDGRFKTLALRPGHYRVGLTTKQERLLWMGDYDLAPNQTLDIGLHQYRKPGHLELRLVSPSGEPVTGVGLVGTRNGRSTHMVLFDKAGVIQKKNLQPGRYRFSTWGKSSTMTAIEVEVLAGKTTKMEMVIPEGVERAVRYPPVAREDMMIRQVWRNESGQIVKDSWSFFSPTEKPQTVVRRFVPGRYTVELTDLLGNKARASFTVDEHATSDEVFELPLPKAAARK